MKYQFSFALLIALLVFVNSATAQYGGAAAPPDNLKKGYDSITADQAKEWLATLAGPQFEGRGTGQVGYTRAAHWVAGKLAEFGYEPIGDQGTYFQMMPMVRRTPDMSKCKITGPDGLVIDGEGNLGFERFTDQPELEGKVVL